MQLYICFNVTYSGEILQVKNFVNLQKKAGLKENVVIFIFANAVE